MSAVGDTITVTLSFAVTGTAGTDYGNEAITPEFVAEYLQGAGDVLVPGTSVSVVTATDTSGNTATRDM